MSIHTENAPFSPPESEGEIRILFGEFRPSLRDWNYRENSSDSWRLYWNSSPGAGLVRNGKVFRLDGSRIALIPPLTVFSSFAENEFSHLYIHFTVSAPFDRMEREIHLLPAGCAEKELREAIETKSSYRFRMRLHRVVSAVLLNLSPEKFLPVTTPGPDPRIKAALELLNRETELRYDCRKICRCIKMSPNNFHLLFKRETGLTPMRYLRGLKMEKAAWLLSHSVMPVKEIAERTGFADRYHFSKAFKAFFNLSPVKYRFRNNRDIGENIS